MSDNLDGEASLFWRKTAWKVRYSVVSQIISLIALKKRSLVQMKYQPEKWLYSYWRKETRFYRLELCQNLWGQWIVKRTWGSAVRGNAS